MSGVGVFGEEQLELRKTVAQLLSKRADAAALRKTLESGEAFDRGLWDVLCQQVGVAALAFCFALGRLGRISPRATALLLSGCALLAVYVVPFLKYPANPPSVPSFQAAHV